MLIVKNTQCHVLFFAGKTYVGLKIAKALLNNSMVWSANSPMLVVCYTNHALDQFLEGNIWLMHFLFDFFCCCNFVIIISIFV